MIKDGLKYIVGLSEAKIHEITLPDGTIQMYSDKELHRLDKHIPKASAIEMHTLSSLVDYIKSHVDAMAEDMIIHIVSPEEVRFFSMLDENRQRETLVVVNAQIPSFSYGKFIDHETFCINVQSKFVNDPDTDKQLLLRFAGTVESGSVAEYGDDGVTQKATVRQGIASKTEAVVPNPVNLKPFRTFVEVPQPASDFVFRMNQSRVGGIECALFEADGGAWKNDAMKNIKDYLTLALEGNDFITIIS